MNDYELMRASENCDDAIELNQFTTEQISQLAKQKSKNNFKQNYFDFYDDVKSHTLNSKQDW